MVANVTHKSLTTVQTVVAPVAKKTSIAPQPAALKLQPMKRPQINYDVIREREQLKQAVSSLNAQLEKGKTGLGFSINNSVSIPVVTVQDKATGKIVRQFPNQTAVNMAQSIDQLKGRLFTGKA